MWRALGFLLLLACSYNSKSDYIGSEYLGATYIDNPLGEGVAPDTDPLIRYDAFDCVTFVETALADGNITKLNKIRYANGTPNFLTRNHFIETDWLENNADILTNVSAQYAKTATRNVTIDKKAWFKNVHSINTNFKPRNVSLEYIPYANAHNIKVSKPMVVLFIINSAKTKSKIGTDLGVRHAGFLLPDGRLRHASRLYKQVVDTNFDKYINRLLENPNNLGIMLLEIKNDR